MLGRYKNDRHHANKKNQQHPLFFKKLLKNRKPAFPVIFFHKFFIQNISFVSIFIHFDAFFALYAFNS